jgi:hypothetical protein
VDLPTLKDANRIGWLHTIAQSVAHDVRGDVTGVDGNVTPPTVEAQVVKGSWGKWIGVGW